MEIRTYCEHESIRMDSTPRRMLVMLLRHDAKAGPSMELVLDSADPVEVAAKVAELRRLHGAPASLIEFGAPDPRARIREPATPRGNRWPFST